MNQFTLYWLDGKREVVEGATIADAFNRAGYGGGAIRALDFFDYGNSNKYEWIKGTNGGTWKIKTAVSVEV